VTRRVTCVTRRVTYVTRRVTCVTRRVTYAAGAAALSLLRRGRKTALRFCFGSLLRKLRACIQHPSFPRRGLNTACGVENGVLLRKTPRLYPASLPRRGMSNCLCEAIAWGVLRKAQNSKLKPLRGLSPPPVHVMPPPRKAPSGPSTAGGVEMWFNRCKKRLTMGRKQLIIRGKRKICGL
jgi:hypothetical protein